jgi:hypothetical protein
VCDQETSKRRRQKAATGLWKILPQWVVTPRKQKTNKLYTKVAKKRPLPKSSFYAIVNQLPDDGQKIG